MQTLLIGLLIVGLTVTLDVAGLLATRRLVPGSALVAYHDVNGAFFHVIGATYGVLLAFVVVIV